MLYVHLVLEDTTVTAEWAEDYYDREKNENVKDGKQWDVTITDKLTDKIKKVRVTNMQMSAIAALGIGYGEETEADKDVTTKLYDTLKPLDIPSWDRDLSPIP